MSQHVGSIPQDDADLLWVDHRDEEDGLVEAVSARIAPEDAMTFEWRDEEAWVSYRDEAHRLPLTFSPVDRYVALSSIAWLLRDRYAVWLLTSSLGGDTHGLLLLPIPEAAAMSAAEVAALEARFTRLALGHCHFHDAPVPYVDHPLDAASAVEAAPMNILYVNHYHGSPAHGMEFRPYYLAREWVRAGHRVQMLAASFSHVRAVQPAMPADGRPLDEVIDGIAYRWYPTPAYQGNGVARVKNIAAFCTAAWRDTERLVEKVRPDVVIASSTYPMDIWVARHIARRANATLVFEVHDLWPLSPIELSGMSPRQPFALLCAWAEGTAYRDADVVVSMLPCVHDYMASRGLDLARLVVVPNGISPDDWAAAPAPLRADVADAIAAARAKGHTVVGYAGSMGLPNALDVLLDAAGRLRDTGEPISIVLVGDGHERARLAARVPAESLANVSFLPPIPKAQVPSFLAAIDIAYIGWQRVPIYRFGIAPNKLMDYLMAGRAVLHSVEAGNDPVAEAGCGITVPPEDPAAVADGLRRLVAVGAVERAAMGERGRAYVLARHTYPVLAQRFLDAVRSAATRRRAG